MSEKALKSTSGKPPGKRVFKIRKRVLEPFYGRSWERGQEGTKIQRLEAIKTHYVHVNLRLNRKFQRFEAIKTYKTPRKFAVKQRIQSFQSHQNPYISMQIRGQIANSITPKPSEPINYYVNLRLNRKFKRFEAIETYKIPRKFAVKSRIQWLESHQNP